MNKYDKESIERDCRLSDLSTLKIIKQNLVLNISRTRASVDYDEKYLAIVEQEINNKS